MTKWEYVVLQILNCFWLGITCFMTIHTEVLIYLKILTMTYIQVVCPCHQCVRNLYTLKIFRQWCVMENMCLSREAPCYSVFGGTWAAWSWLCSKLCVICLHTCFSRWNFSRWCFTSVPSHQTALAGSVPAIPCASARFPGNVLPLFPLHCLAWVHLRYY